MKHMMERSLQCSKSTAQRDARARLAPTHIELKAIAKLVEQILTCCPFELVILVSRLVVLRCVLVDTALVYTDEVAGDESAVCVRAR